MRALIKFLSFMAVLGLMFYVRYYFSFWQVERNSTFFVTEAVNSICTKWDVAEFEKMADDSLKSGATFATVFGSYRKLGYLTTPAHCVMSDFTSYKYKDAPANYIAANYECRGAFESGPATIHLTVLRFQEGSEWKIGYFDVAATYPGKENKEMPGKGNKEKK